MQGTAERFYSYKAEVEALAVKLNQEMDSSLTQPGQRILITSHDAFEYFGDAFKFKVRGLQGISTAAEYGAKDVKTIHMGTGNKISRIIAWTFLTKEEQRVWKRS